MTQNLGRPETGGRKPLDKFSKTLRNMMQKKSGKNQNASYVVDDDDEGKTQQFGKIKREINKETGKSQKTNLFRDMCFKFQLAGANYQKVTNNIDRDLKDDKLDQGYLVGQIFTNLKNQNDESLFDLLNECLKDFKDKSKRNFIKLSKWLDRLHHEMDKFFIMERLFLLISRRIIKYNCTFIQLLLKQRAIIRQQAQYDELTALKYDNLFKDNKIAANEFFKILEKLGIIRVNNKEDFENFIDEYGIVDEEVSKQQGLVNEISKEQDKTDTNQNKDDIKEDIEEQNENNKLKQIEDLKKQIDSTYIRIDELEADFEHFQQKIFPKIEERVLNLIFNFCINVKISPRKLFFSKEIEKKQEDQNKDNDENDNIEKNDFKEEKIHQNNDFNENENKKDELNYKSYVDDLDLYYIADMIKIYENQENSYASDYSKIFQIFALNVSNTLNEKKIKFAYIYTKLQKIVQQNDEQIQNEIEEKKYYEQDQEQYLKINLQNYLIFSNIKEFHKGAKNIGEKLNEILDDYKNINDYSQQIEVQLDLIKYDQQLNQKVIEDMKNQLLKFLASELYNKKTKIEFDKIFEYTGYPTFQILFRILTEKFSTRKFQMFGNENLKLICMSYQNNQNQYYNSNQNQLDTSDQNFDIKLDIEKFRKDVEKEYRVLIIKENIIEKLSGALRSLGFQYETMFQKILGIRNIEKAVISKDQLYQAFVLLEYKISTKEFEIFFASFTEFVEDEEINVSLIIKQARIIEKEYLTFKKNKAKRRYNGLIKEILEYVGEQISNGKLKDFGQILKGQDFKDDGNIQNNDFFQTIESIREFVEGPFCLHNGDIMDLINNFDSQNKGFINLEEFKDEINYYIQDKNYVVILKSKVKNICNEQILDQDVKPTQFKVKRQNQHEILKPKNLNSIVIDIYCGVYNIDKNLEDFLDKHIGQIGVITEEEFEKVIEILNVQINGDLSKEIYQYLIQIQAHYKDEEQDNIQDSSLLKTGFLLEQLQLNISRKYSAADIKKYLLQQIVQIISKEEIPLLDLIDGFRGNDQNNDENNNSSKVSLEDFKNNILQDYLKLSYIMTDNKVQFLSEPYIDPNNNEFVEIDRFIQDIRQTINYLNLNKQAKKLEIFDHQSEIDNYKNSQKAEKQNEQDPKIFEPTFKIKKGNFIEQVYIQRSDFNTYMTIQERQKLGKSYISSESSCATMMKDIMLRTRANGKSVEEYFKYFGKIMPHGLTELTPDQFRLGVKNLNLPWAENLNILNIVLNSLDQDEDKEERGTIDMQEIAKGIIDSQSHNIQYYENEYLEKLFNYMTQNNQFKLLKEQLKILNFNRDYSCSVEQFKNLFHDNLRIPESCLEDWQVNILMFRYTFKQQNSLFLRVSFIQMFTELLERKKGFKFEEQIFTKMSSDLYKCMKYKMPQENFLTRFIELRGDSRLNQISEKIFVQACVDISFDKLYSFDQINFFLQFLSQSQEKNNQQHNQRNITNNLQKYGYLTAEQIYQDVVNQVFIQSLRIQQKQNALTIFTDVDELDGTKDGHITVEQFVSTVKKIIGKAAITNIDLEFLSQKYRNMAQKLPEDRDKVFYKFFYQDYQELLDKGVHVLGIDEIDESNVAPEKDPFTVEIPQKFFIFYENIQKWIQKQNDVYLSDKFCSMLVEKDSSGKGFLSNRQFDECFQEIGMQLSKKQVGQATYCLHQDQQGRYSFHELINHIFGPAKLLDFKTKFGLQSNYIDSISNQSEKQYKQIQISSLLQNQMSFKYNELLESQKLISEGSNMLLEGELIQCISQNDIILSQQDKNALQVYFQLNKNRMNKTISLKDIFTFYNIDQRIQKLFIEIKNFYMDSSTHQVANQYLKAQEYYFEDFLMFFQMTHFYTSTLDEKVKNKSISISQKNLDAKVEFKNLYELFEVLREEKPYLKKNQIRSLLNITEMRIYDEDNQNKVWKRKPQSVLKDKNQEQKQKKDLQDKTLQIFEKFILKDQKKIQKLEKIKDQMISEDEFRQLLVKLEFKIDDKQAQDIIINRFIDKKQNKISIINLKRFFEIPVSIPAPSQKIRMQNSLEKEYKIRWKDVIKTYVNFNQQTKDILQSLQQFLKQNNKSDLKKLFKEMDKNGNNLVDQKEFISYFIKIKDRNSSQNNKLSELDKIINETNLQTLFQSLDIDNSNSVSLIQFGSFIKHVEDSNNQIIQNAGSQNSKILDVDIDKYFRRVDSNHNELEDADDLYQLFKPQRPEKISLTEVKQIINMYDKDNNGMIGTKEFQVIVKQELIKDLTNSTQNFEDYKKILKAKNQDQDNHLTIQEFSSIIYDELNVSNIKKEELECLIQLLDDDQNQIINTDSFFTNLFVKKEIEPIKI